MAEIPVRAAFIFTEIEGGDAVPSEARKTEQIGDACLPRIIDAGDAQPEPPFILQEEQMTVITISVQEKAVVGQRPEPARQQSEIGAFDFTRLDFTFFLGGSEIGRRGFYRGVFRRSGILHGSVFGGVRIVTG